MFGLAATGREISNASAAYYRIENTRIVEGWVLGDLVHFSLRVRGISFIEVVAAKYNRSTRNWSKQHEKQRAVENRAFIYSRQT
jgi:hypothetical protein